MFSTSWLGAIVGRPAGGNYSFVHFCIKFEEIEAQLSSSYDVDRVSPAGTWVGLVAPKTFYP
jgi:hypothetical protein